jgi:hypothetical protein
MKTHQKEKYDSQCPDLNRVRNPHQDSAFAGFHPRFNVLVCIRASLIYAIRYRNRKNSKFGTAIPAGLLPG